MKQTDYIHKTEEDNEAFDQALKHMADSVTGSFFKNSYANDKDSFLSALKESLKVFHVSVGKKDKTDRKHEKQKEKETLDDFLNSMLLPHGLMYRMVKLDKDWYKLAYGSMLGTFKDTKKTVSIIQNHFGHYCYIDPETHKKIRIHKGNADIFEDEAIVFYRPFPLRAITVSDLMRFMLQTFNAWDYISIVLSFAVVTILGLFLPNLNSLLFSQVPENQDYTLLFTVAVFMVSLVISTVIFSSVKQIVMLRVQTKLNIAINSATFMRMLSLPASFFRQYSSGELYSYDSAIQGVCSSLFNSVFSTGLTAVMSLSYISTIFIYAPRLVIPALIIIVVSIIFMVASALVKKRQTEKVMKASAKSKGTSVAMIGGVRKIRLTGSEKRAFVRWSEDYSAQAHYSYNQPFLIAINPAITAAISLIGMIVLYYIAISSQISVAHFQAFNVSYGMVSGAFSALASIALIAAQISPMLKMAKPLMETAPEIIEGGEEIDGIHKEIEFSHVTFSYSKEQPPVFKDLSLKLRAGEYVAIVGKTGCGKSTLVRLLLGFEKAQEGTISYDGKEISTLNIVSLRKHIGAVTQNGKLFPGSIYSNIVISAPQLSMDDAWKAAETAGIADDINAMPMGMLTMISEGTGGISGGQKQRLMIARAIAPDPDLLIFDEATSALDNVTQEKVTSALNALSSTRIVIAHRLSTIQKCDRILMLENGQITESGTYDELMEKGGSFKALVERQQV